MEEERREEMVPEEKKGIKKEEVIGNYLFSRYHCHFSGHYSYESSRSN